MLSLVKFTFISNAIAATIVFMLRLFSDYVASWMVIDLMFLTGIVFWTISTLVRLGSKRFKKESQRNDMVLTDPQLVLQSNSIAARFLAAGLPGIVGAIVWGFFY